MTKLRSKRFGEKKQFFDGGQYAHSSDARVGQVKRHNDEDCREWMGRIKVHKEH